ncbi:hypothetical protein KEM54_002144 [Ascosphaera aggregata]|nr:hypothetical protein KEM54_002144 [Ascosphaera aggregata]
MHVKFRQDDLTVFKGTFIDLAAEPDVPATATSAPTHNLRIRDGVVAVKDGRITTVDWSIKSENDFRKFLKSNYGYEEDEGALLAYHTHGKVDHGSSQVRIVRASDERNGFFFPGFIDTHIHAPQYQNSGIFGKSTLLDWLATYTFPLESSFCEQNKKDKDVYHRTKYDTVPPHLAYDRVVQRTLANGTTCASYFGTIHVPATHMLARICHERGQRALIGRVCMDRKETCAGFYRDESTEESLAAARESAEAILNESNFKKGLIQPIVTPRFAPSCTAEALTGLAEIAASYDPPLRIQTHISENVKEVAWVKELFPGSKSYTDIYDRHGLLTPRMILAHAIHLSPSERELIRKRGSGVAHCPSSNSAIGSGICPVRTLLDCGIPVGLGTDVSGGWSSSMLEVVRQTCLASRLLEFSHEYINDQQQCGKNDIEHERQKISVAEALYLATRGGARVVSMHGDDGVGGFDVGKQFDAQMIELGRPLAHCHRHEVEQYDQSWGNVDIFGWESWEEKIDKWVWNGDDRNVKGVWVAGTAVHR